MLSIGEILMARMALENVLAQLYDRQEIESLRQAVDNTIQGKPIPEAPAEGEVDADTVSNYR